MLRSNEEQAPVSQNKSMGDVEELAASYERKLIEVSALFIISYIIYLLLGIDYYASNYSLL